MAQSTHNMLSFTNDSQHYRHGSFAPVREGCKAVWYMDGKDYMSAVADAIMAAETEIMITDWQMNPEIFMKRPDSGVNSLDWRLDKMLLKMADKGVKVKILLYKGMKLLNLGSGHVVEVLKHQNIEVHCHPDIVIGAQNLFWWGHHEKMVIVDHSIAFVGGIDLCYGRWDTRNHELMVNYPVHPAVDGREASDDNPHEYARWIGKDYINTFYNKEERMDWEKPLEGYEGVERNTFPRLLWHDVACAFIGEAVQDAVQHFTDIYHAITKVSPNPIRQPTTTSKKTKAEEIVSNSRGYNVRIQLLRSVDNWSAGQKHEASIYNAYIDAIKNAQHFSSSFHRKKVFHEKFKMISKQHWLKELSLPTKPRKIFMLWS